MSATRFGHRLVQVGMGQGVAGFLKFALPVVVARMLGAHEFGEFSIGVVVVLLAFNLGSLGISSSTTFHVAGHRREAHVAAYNSLLLSLLLGLAVTAAGAAVVVAGHRVLGLPETPLLVALTAVPAYFVVNTAMGFALGREDYAAYNAINAGFYGAVLVGAVAAIAVAPTASAALAGWSAGAVLAALASAVYLRHHWRGGRSLDRRFWRDVTVYGAKVHVSNMVTFLNFRVDLLLVGALAGTTDAGVYAAAVSVGEMVWFFSQVASWVLFARVANDTDAMRRRRLTTMTTRLVLSTSAAVATVIALGAVPILSVLYGPSFVRGADALRVLLIGVVTLSASRVLANAIAGYGEPQRNIPGSVVALVVNTLLNLALIPWIGIVGSAAASAISYSLTLALRVREFGAVAGSPRSTARDCLVPCGDDLRTVARAATARAPRALT